MSTSLDFIFYQYVATDLQFFLFIIAFPTFIVFCKKYCLFSFLAEANKDATKTVIEAVVADHGGTDKCPWSATEMKGNCTCNCSCLLQSLKP